MRLERFGEQQIAQNLLAMFSQSFLLLFRAVILERQDHRKFGRDERRVGDGLHHVLEQNVGAQRHAVRDYRLLVFLAVPAVELDASTAGEEHTSVHLDARLAAELTSDQVGVVRRVDEVVTQRLVHVLVDVEAVEEDGRVVLGHEKVVEALFAHALFLFVLDVRLVQVDQTQYAVAVEVRKDDLV